ncbi:MAG: BACON domain-containing protein [Vicinamibacterales bacterium]
MKRLLSASLALLTLALLASACGGSSKNETPPSSAPTPGPSPVPSPSPAPSPTPSGCTAGVTGIPASIPGQGGRYQFSIGLASTCAWTARTDVGWADVAPGSGSGSATPTLNVNSNSTFFTRQFTVNVNGQIFQATQGSVGCTYTLDPTALNESHEGGTARVNLSTADGCGWTASASEAWLKVLTPTGTGSGTIYIELAPNPSDVRNAFLTIAGRQVPVQQRRRP